MTFWVGLLEPRSYVESTWQSLGFPPNSNPKISGAAN